MCLLLEFKLVILYLSIFNFFGSVFVNEEFSVFFILDGLMFIL